MATYRARQNATQSHPIHFFKIILKTNVERIKIPNKFTRKYGDGLSNPVYIQTPDGAKWEVYWTKQINGEVWLEGGWKEFAEKYSLDHGHLVLFKYEGTSQFEVLILDQSAVEIDYPSLNTCDEEEDELNESVRFMGEIPPPQKARPKSPLMSSPQSHKRMRNATHGNVETSSNPQKLNAGGDQSNKETKFQKKTTKHELKGEDTTTQRTMSLNFPKRTRALKIAKRFVTSNPFFTVVISPTNSEIERKHVPKFIEMEGVKRDVKLQLGERWWTVTLVSQCHRNSRYDIFTSGWSSFVTQNKLKVDDVCIFELIDQVVPVLKVHVFQKKKLLV